MVIPHSYSHIHSIGLKQEINVAHLFDPVVETLLALSLELEDKVYQLLLRSREVLLVALELIGIVHSIVLVPVESPIVSIPEIGRSSLAVNTFPEEALVALEHIGDALLDELVIDRLNHVIYAKIGLLLVALDVKPHAAISRKCAGPDAVTAEKIVAIKLTDIARVILEPLQVHLSYTFDSVVIILVELTEINSEMAVMPVGSSRIMYLTGTALRTAS